MIQASEVVLSTASSVLFVPMIKTVPIIHAEADTPTSKVFSQLGRNVFFNWKKGESLTAIIRDIENGAFNEKRKKESRRLSALMNYNNDGKGTERMLQLIEDVFAEAGNRKNFYPLSVEGELLESLERFPQLPYPYQNLIKHYAENGDAEKANHWFETYCRKFNQPQPIFSDLVRLYLKKKNTPEDIYEFLIPYYERNLLEPRRIFELAVVCRLLERFDEAVNFLKEALAEERSKENKKIMEYELGLALLQKGEPGRAISHFRNSLKRTSTGDPIKPRVYFRLGEAFTRMNQYNAAMRELKKCLKLCPQHKAAQNVLETLIDKT